MKSAFSAALYSSVLSIVGTVHSVYMLLKSNKNKFVASTCLCVTLAAEGISDAFISDRVKTKKKGQKAFRSTESVRCKPSLPRKEMSRALF